MQGCQLALTGVVTCLITPAFSASRRDKLKFTMLILTEYTRHRFLGPIGREHKFPGGSAVWYHRVGPDWPTILNKKIF